MFEPQTIRSEHKDVIHDVAYDYYGLRWATCSSDHFVKVWDKNENGIWTVTASWKAHSGSVWRLSWAHPEFGQILATCSFDRTVSVWEETVAEKTTTMTPIKRWFRKTSLVDSRTNVTDVKFGPKHLGLLLASCSVDGIIRIYEASDIMNLSQWTLVYDIPCKLPLSCISWNNSMYRLHAPMIAVGSDDSTTSAGGKVFIFEQSTGVNGKWTKTETINSVAEPVHDIAFAPNVGRSYHILAVAGKDVHIFHIHSSL